MALTLTLTGRKSKRSLPQGYWRLLWQTPLPGLRNPVWSTYCTTLLSGTYCTTLLSGKGQPKCVFTIPSVKQANTWSCGSSGDRIICTRALTRGFSLMQERALKDRVLNDCHWCPSMDLCTKVWNKNLILPFWINSLSNNYAPFLWVQRSAQICHQTGWPLLLALRWTSPHWCWWQHSELQSQIPCQLQMGGGWSPGETAQWAWGSILNTRSHPFIHVHSHGMGSSQSIMTHIPVRIYVIWGPTQPLRAKLLVRISRISHSSLFNTQSRY